MKILTKEEEAAHYNATLKGGISGGAIGMILVSHYSSLLLSLAQSTKLTTIRAEQQYTEPQSASVSFATSLFLWYVDFYL